MQHIFAALRRAAPPPVRRGSLPAGTFERGWWRPMARQDAQRLVLAARKYEIATRRKGARNGALGHVALEVLALLANLVQRRTGQLDPALAYLVRTLKRSKAAIVRALAALRAHGFLDWRRRFTPAPREGRGPQIRQASNAYRLQAPPEAARLLAPPAPPPDLDRPQAPRSEASQRLHDLLDGMAAQRGFTPHSGVS